NRRTAMPRRWLSSFVRPGFSERRNKHRSFWPPPGMAGGCCVHHLGSAKALVAELRRRDETTAAEAADRGCTAKAHEAFAAQRQPAGIPISFVPFSRNPNTAADLLPATSERVAFATHTGGSTIG